MFSCFKCCHSDDDEEYHQRPKSRNNSTVKSSQRSSRTVTSVDVPGNVNAKETTKNTNKSMEQIRKECLEAHNIYRAKHGSSPLTLDKQLNNLAAKWAEHLANSNTLQHRKNNKYGENLYMATGMVVQTHELAVKAWYDEIENYNFNKPGFSSSTGHFTQVVWKSSKQLGVGVVKKGNRTWVVCNYDPPGNVMGNYSSNVPHLIEDTINEAITKMKGRRYAPGKQEKAATIKAQHDAKQNAKEETSTAATYSDNDLRTWSKYELECLTSHNKYRAIHGSPSMKLNRNLCNLAQDWSKHLAKQRSMSHRPQNEYGENIYYAMNFDPSAEHCVKSWYDEIKDYNFSRPGFSSTTGHFTQVVWRDSIELGVGITKVNNMTFVVCNYAPAGNVMGQYKDQVARPGTITITSIPTSRSTGSSSNKNQTKINDQQSFQEVCLGNHNSLRSIHGSPAMTLNNNSSLLANDWAQVRTTKMSYTIRTTITKS